LIQTRGGDTHHGCWDENFLFSMWPPFCQKICALMYMSAAKTKILSTLANEIATLTTSSAVEVLPVGVTAPLGCSVSIVDEATTVNMLLTGILDPTLEIQKLQKKVDHGLLLLLGSLTNFTFIYACVAFRWLRWKAG
jgi:hypothetical protein